MADVSISLDLDARQLATELQNASTKLNQFASQTAQHGEAAGHGFTGGLQRAFGGIKGFFTNIKDIATSTLGAIGIGLGVGAAIGEVKSVVEFGAHIEDLSRKFGVNAEVLSKWGFAAQKTGTDVDALAKFIGFLEVNREKAAKGGEKQLADFKALGVTAEQIKDPLLSIGEIMKKISASSLDPAALKGVGGKGALDVRTLLAGVGEGTVDLDKSLKSSDTAKLKELSDSFINLKQVLTTELAPAIVSVFDFISTQAGGVGAHIEALKTRIHEAVIQVTALAKLGIAVATNNPVAIVDALKGVRDARAESQALEVQLAPKLLANPDPDQKSVEEAKAHAAKPKRDFSLLAGGEEEAADAKADKKTAKAEDKNDREARKIALDQLKPQERLTELLKEADQLEEKRNSAKEGPDKTAAQKNYLDVLRELAATKKEVERELAQQDKKDTREEAKSEKEHESDLKDELRDRGLLGGGRSRGGGRGRGGGRAAAVDEEHLLEQQDQLDKAIERDEADRRAHGSYTGPGGGKHSGLVSSGGLTTGHLQTGSLTDNLSDKDFHAQFQRGGGLKDRLSPEADFKKQFQPIGLTRADEVKRAQVGKEAEHKPAEKLDTAADKLSKVAEKLDSALHI